MMRRYSFNDDERAGEREPLDNPYNNGYMPNSPAQWNQPYQSPQYNYDGQQQLPSFESPHGPGASHPSQQQPSSGHPAFAQHRAARRMSREREDLAQDISPQPYTQQQSNSPSRSVGYGAPAGAVGVMNFSSPHRKPVGSGPNSSQPHGGSPSSRAPPPAPPPHRYPPQAYGQEPPHSPPGSNVTPGADNFSEAAAGGMAGIAYSVAERNARESGLEASRPSDGRYNNGNPHPPQQSHQPNGMAMAYDAPPLPNGAQTPRSFNGEQQRHSNTSLEPLRAAAGPTGRATPGQRSPARSSPQHSETSGSMHHGHGGAYAASGAMPVYTDDPYQALRRTVDPSLGMVNPHEIEDDGDEGLEYRRPARTSMISLSSLGGGGERGSMRGSLRGSLRNGRSPSATRGDGNRAAAGLTAGAGVMGWMGRSGQRTGGSSSRAQSTGSGRSGSMAGGVYGPVPSNGQAGTAYGGGAAVAGSDVDLGGPAVAEKPPRGLWRADELEKRRKRKKWAWIIVLVLGLIIGGGVAAGVTVPLVSKKNGGGGGRGSSAIEDADRNGDLDINSSEIKALMNNKDLHRVFPGIDYTPLNSQYPDCLHNPPSQNNVTRDVAVLSQLTNTIRLYGTDCNQTEMLLHAIDRLRLKDSVKVWLGVWQDNNATTNARQLAQMWNILDTYGTSPFKGIIVANEILFRQQMTVSELGTLLASVRANLTARGMSLPVATSDLGDKWTAELAAQSDYIMANIHPFFAGVGSAEAAAWTNAFWQNHNGAFFKADKSKNIISETGWPSQGGTHCGSATILNCAPNGAKAGIEHLNRFMQDWVCPALANGTEYFWFESFDEPWKVVFNEPGKEWEDHWGLMDVNRKLKPGVKIPDCGGKTV